MRPLLTKGLACLLLCASALAVFPQVPIIPGDVLVMLRPEASAARVATDLAAVQGVPTDVKVVKEVSAPMRAWLFHFDERTVPQETMLRAFRNHPAVQLAQNNHVISERSTPNDPQFAQQWQHQNIQSAAAWDITTGGITAAGDTIVVAIMEKADLGHPDLAANAWINRGEIPNNGIDDDGNGYVDDVRGWDPAAQNDNVYSGFHGTEVAGMVGAVGNNGTQVVGANWSVKLMPVNYANTEEASVLASYTYPLVMRRLYNSSNGQHGAFVVATNASWGVDNGQPADAPLWCAMYDTLGAAGVLNCASTTNNNVDVDVVGDLPTACPSDFMISVTATNNNDMRTFSGWGATTVDVGAPGANVWTTTMGGGTGSASGTSFASPLTAGVVALLYSVPCASLAAIAHNDPMEAALRVRHALFAGVDQVGNLPGHTVTGGRINAFHSAQFLIDSCETCPVPYNMAATSNAIGSATLSWNAMPGTYSVRYRLIGTSDWTVVPGISSTDLPINGLATCQPYEFQVAADCDSTTSAYSPSYTWTSEGCCTAPLSITATANDTVSATVAWSTVLASTAYDLRYRAIGAPDWTELDGLAGNSTTLNGLVPCSDLEVQMRSSCGGQTANWSATAVVHIPGCGQCVEGNFCNSAGDATYEWIANVHLAGIDRTSGADGGYAGVDATNQSTALSIGATYPISLAPGYSGSLFAEYFTVWMDLDHNGQFTADEKVLDAGSAMTAALNDSLTVPATATPGSTRMRVVMKYQTPPASGCGSYDFGETEDYCITLTNGPVAVADREGTADVRLYPVPADRSFTLTTAHPSALQLVLSDATGRTVLRQAVINGRCTVDVASLGSGLYHFQLLSGAAILSRGHVIVAH
jgi:hypothetical protein